MLTDPQLDHIRDIAKQLHIEHGKLVIEAVFAFGELKEFKVCPEYKGIIRSQERKKAL